MNKSESLKELAAALSKAQAQIKGAVKDSTNPFFKASYADLTSVWDACRKPLTDNGLSIIQTNDISENGVVVETILAHSSGEWIMGRLHMTPVKNDPQGIGSAITYGRRYGLAAIVGVCPEDDDANAASGQKPAEKKTPPPSSNKAPSPEPPLTPFGKFLKTMEGEKKRIGEKDYYTILGNNGVEHCNEIKDRKAQLKVYEEMEKITSL